MAQAIQEEELDDFFPRLPDDLVLLEDDGVP